LGKEPHICPACERTFKEFTDYPRILVTSVVLMKPEDVPAGVPFGEQEYLLNTPKEGSKLATIPYLVFDFLRSNPKMDSYAFTDGFVYERPYDQLPNRRKLSKKYEDMVPAEDSQYRRKPNYAPAMRALLEINKPLKEYLASLKALVGSDVPVTSFLPKWKKYHHYPAVFQIPTRISTAAANGLLLGFMEKEEGKTSDRTIPIYMTEEARKIMI
jgi:hypothetical protein